MLIIGCDLHSRFQQIAMLGPQTGEFFERQYEHATGEGRASYAALPGSARVGPEATVYAHWIEAMLVEHGHQLWVGDGAEIRAVRVRKQKTDSRECLSSARLAVRIQREES